MEVVFHHFQFTSTVTKKKGTKRFRGRVFLLKYSFEAYSPARFFNETILL